MEMLSGLWHHLHFRLQPLKKTVVRIPGPSSVDIRWISRILALGLESIVADSFDNFILQLPAYGCEVGVITGYPY